MKWLWALFSSAAVALGAAVPQDVSMVRNPTFQGNILPVQIQWTNTDLVSSIGLDYSTNGSGGTYYRLQTKNPGAVLSDVISIPQSNTWYFKLTYDGVNFSSIVSQWGEQQPGSVVPLVGGSNQVAFTFTDNAWVDDGGYRIEQATNSAFTGTTSNFFFPKVVGTNAASATITNDFAFGETYYWRIYSTNTGADEITQPSETKSASPNNVPGQPRTLSLSLNPAGNVVISWQASYGWVQEYLVQFSVTDTNGFDTNTIFAVVAGNSSESRTDTGQSVGTKVYYRIMATNEIGSTSSDIKSIVISPSETASTFYISPDGDGSHGTNWATAWPNFASINWNSLQPGSTVWVTNGLYDEQVNIPDAGGSWSGGTSNLPIRFKYWTNNPAGVVRLVSLVNLYAAIGYVTFDGARSDNYHLNTITEITNNIGIQFLGNTNVNVAVWTTANGWQMRWIEATGDYANQNETGEGVSVLFAVDSGAAENCKFLYCWGHDATNDLQSGVDGIKFQNYTIADTNSYGNIEVGWCLFERLSDNYMTGTLGHGTVHDSIFRQWQAPITGSPPHSHPDGLQAGCNHTCITNIQVYDVNGYALYVEAAAVLEQDVFIVNSSFFSTVGGLPQGAISFSTEPGGTASGISITFSNVVVAHNTFIGVPSLTLTMRDTNSDLTISCTNFTLQKWTVENNLAQDGIGVSVSISELGANTGQYFQQASNEVTIQYNCVYGTNSEIGFNGTNYSPSVWGVSNFIYAPTFTDTNTADWRPTQADGTNMVVLKTTADRDAMGLWREVFGYIAGAYVPPLDSSCVLYASFNAYTGTNALEDATAYRNDLLLENVSSNWPTLVTATNGLLGASISNYQYFVVTNLNGMTPLTNGTIALWGIYSAASAADSVFLSAGEVDGLTNSWWFGGDSAGSDDTRMWIHDDAGNKTNGVAFGGFVTNEWRHYAVTWAGNVFIGYTNGVAFVTNTIANAPFREVVQPYHWMAVGCCSHNGTPDFTDDEGAVPSNGYNSYPNNGWLNGSLASLQIYNQALSAVQVENIYLGVGSGVTPPTPPSTNTGKIFAIGGRTLLKATKGP